jgi:hypothetical protein
MFNCHATAEAFFEEPLNDYKSIQCTRIVTDYYDADHARGAYGGGVLDARPLLNATPIMFALGGLPPDAPAWGREYKRQLAQYFTRNCGGGDATRPRWRASPTASRSIPRSRTTLACPRCA